MNRSQKWRPLQVTVEPKLQSGRIRAPTTIRSSEYDIDAVCASTGGGLGRNTHCAPMRGPGS